MQALAQARNLRARGYDSTVITLRHDRAWPKCDEIEGVPVLRVGGRLVAGRERLPGALKKLTYLAGMLMLAWTLWRRRGRYDILHVFQLNLLAVSTALACRLTGKPMIVAVRSTSTIEVEGTETHSEVGGDLAPLEALGKPVVRLARALLRRNHAVVVVLSTRMRSYLAVHDFILPDVRLIPNGVDVSRFTPPRGATTADRAHCVVCVSKLRYEKGIDVLLQAWRQVQAQLSPPGSARLVIVGDGPLRAELERLAGELDIADSVEFAGLQSDVPAQLYRGGLAVLPSRWEGMPNALLEAMACGLACVATRVSGSEDIIQHGINGLLVEPGDNEGMAQALLTLLRDSALAGVYGRAARETVEQQYAFERIMNTYVELYRSLVGETSVKAEDTSVSEMSHVL